ncbi:MAG: WYL domain-containing protein [Oscillospiraceae bacterium]|nr:WYL domain-containing protein [Oscillospiraceae bacterium]
MSYSELIKNFDRIREYMIEFYVYGFKSREEYTQKSSRSYDDERRRLESWFGDYIRINYTPDGKNFSLSIDSRSTGGCPLYAAWKAKSFTDGAITLHFIIFDILYSPEIKLSLKEIVDKIEDYTSLFSSPRTFDESTVRKRLREYISLGLIRSEGRGRNILFSRTEDTPLNCTDVLEFFSEVSPCGVVGSYLLDKTKRNDIFTFKHHYITAATDSEIIFRLFEAIHEHRCITIETFKMHKSGSDTAKPMKAVPLKIMMSVQNGRQYVMVYDLQRKVIVPVRTYNIASVTGEEVCVEHETYRSVLDGMLPHIWGVSTVNRAGTGMDHIEFTVRFSDGEQYIYERLEREKRCGTVTRLDDNTALFSADVFDARELVVWIRTFICRITSFSCSDSHIEEVFAEDLDRMYKMYGITEEDEDVLQ